MLFKVRPSVIASWPAWEVRLINAYLQKQPAPEERIEIVLAMLCQLYQNRTRGKEEQPKRVKDYLPFIDPWPDESEYTEGELEIMRALGK